jgi:CubicO group peptidase (beta-lactamase class C family)
MPLFDERMPERIRNAAAKAIALHHLPGIAVGVVHSDDLVFAEAFGVADIESQAPLTPQHGQRIASITKTMVGLCALAAVDDGKLRLDAPIAELLPDVRFIGPGGSTVWHLLTHTSGIGEAPTMEALRDVANPDREAIPHAQEFHDLYPDGVIVEAEPGSKWAYCNNGYALLGEILRRAEGGAELQEIMERRIWQPLGMQDTHILDEPHARLATGYHRAPNDDTRYQLTRAGIPIKDEPAVDGHNIRGKFTPDFNRAMRAAGGVQSTIPDMAKYASALLRRGAGIVRPETFDEMTAPQYAPAPHLTGWGLAFARAISAGRRTFIGHGGAYFGGWNSHLDVLPEENVAVIQHMNVMVDDPGPVFRRILRAVLDVEPQQLDDRPLDAQVLATAPGVYELRMPGPLTNFRPATRTGRVTVERDGDALTFRSRWGRAKDPVRLHAGDQSDGAVVAIERPDGDDPEMLVFERNAAGDVTGLRFDDLVYMDRRDIPA